MNKSTPLYRIASLLVRMVLSAVSAAAITSTTQAALAGSAFTYQGSLSLAGGPAPNGAYDFRFSLHAASAGGAASGSPIVTNALGVTNGLFTVQLDFGDSPFKTGLGQWLQIEVATNGGAPLTLLSPRQRLTPIPQATYAENAALAGSVAAGGVTSAAIAPSAVDSDSIQNGSIETVDLSPALFNGTFWKLGGNTGAGNFLGNIDSQPLELRTDNQVALRLLPSSSTPNVVGGHASNRVGPSAAGAFIGGGGQLDNSNYVVSSFGTIAGGLRNTAAGPGATVGGGLTNGASGYAAFLGGGSRNVASAPFASVVGGFGNMVFETNGTIGGGTGNHVSGNFEGSTISGGINNSIALSQGASISGGIQNRIRGNTSTAAIGGGYQNFIETNGAYGTIAGGFFNLLTETYSAIGGGYLNAAHGTSATIAGGSKNRADASYGTVSGGTENTNSGRHATIAGGGNNLALADFASMGGGWANNVDGQYGTVGGGRANRADKLHTTVAGGTQNRAQSTNSTVGGGSNNSVTGDPAVGSTVSGGVNNYIADSQSSVISGGLQNHISESSSVSTVGGGYQNFIEANSSSATIAGGFFNLINSANYSFIGGGSYNTNSGDYATIPGGNRNAATGDYSFAAGRRAKASHNGTFVWADDTDANFASSSQKQFLVRANGGVGINTNNPQASLHVRGDVAADALRAPGAGVNTGTFAFIHRASAGSISGHITIIDHPLCNGDPSVILLVTHNYSSDTAANRYETEPVGVYYTGSRWAIYHENTAALMPAGRAYNVMVIKP